MAHAPLLAAARIVRGRISRRSRGGVDFDGAGRSGRGRSNSSGQSSGSSGHGSRRRGRNGCGTVAGAAQHGGAGDGVGGRGRVPDDAGVVSRVRAGEGDEVRGLGAAAAADLQLVAAGEDLDAWVGAGEEDGDDLVTDEVVAVSEAGWNGIRVAGVALFS